MNSKDIVRQGYDKVSYAYRNNKDDDDAFNHDYDGWLAELTSLLPVDAKVLDLGCGCGIPVSQNLSQKFTVTEVDISPVQIERAEKEIPEGKFICADMTEIDFPDQSFAAIVSFFAVIHVPLVEQRNLFAKLYRWLQPAGFLMITVGSRKWTGVEEGWLNVKGATMFWSHTDSETYQMWLAEQGFAICWTKIIPEGNGGGHTLIFAQKPED